jgi:hypothetical protein
VNRNGREAAFKLRLVDQPDKTKKRPILFAVSKKSRTFASRLLSKKDKRLIHSMLYLPLSGENNMW